jgi:AraC-like DNA-binding protein
MSSVREPYTVPVRSAIAVLDAARVRPRELTESVGIDDRRLREPTGRIALHQLVALFEAAATRTGERTIGLRVGATMDPRAYDLMGYIIANSATLHQALHSAARYLPLWTDGALLQVIVDGSAAQVIWDYLDPTIVDCRQDCEMSMRAIAEIARRLGRGVTPREVHFRHSAPREAGEHRRQFRSPVRFSMPANQIIFDAAALRTPLLGADPRLCAVLRDYGDGQLAENGVSQSFVDRARVVIKRSPHLGDVARAMGMSPRNLERRLRAQGQSFRGLRARVRRELAEQYLRESDMPVGEIARRLGYSSATELHRAFRVWTGMTPGQFRRPSSI